MDLTTVADDLVVLHDGTRALRYEGLAPDTDHDLDGVAARTLPRPNGELLCRIATVNDVHFGELEAGRLNDLTEGPIRRAPEGAEPYPVMMNRAAAEEIAAIGPAAVIAKGDLSQDGTDEEWEAFERCYRDPFGDRLHVVRGNHDAYRHQAEYAGDQWLELPGVAVALLDTVIPGATTGDFRPQQMTWLSDLAAGSDRPVLVMGHHQQWVGSASGKRYPGYFGLNPDASDRLDEVCAEQRRIVAYTSGHTHRHRVRRMPVSGLPTIEIGCTKDFPGTWAEYRIHEGGMMQVVHRMSSPEALSWSESCRNLYSDFDVDYESYALGELADRCFHIDLR
jgi:3',5'-cyclic AMP phosphodiesterase CpdA